MIMNRFLRLILPLVPILLTPATGLPRDEKSDKLAAGFVSPPDSAKPHTWWHWMNGNISKEGITLDLEAMKRVGLGGFQLFQVGTGIPRGQAPYGSPANVQLLQHAAKEADRLGLEFTLHNCPGWSSSGGPWITPELSMKVLAISETTVSSDGSKRVEVDLSQPAAQQNFYKDAFVLAIPAPADNARIENWNTKAGFPGGRGGGGLGSRGAQPAAPAANSSSPGIDPAKVVDLGKNMNDQGRLTWDAPAGNWIILRIGYTTTGAQNRPGPDGGTGLECDKFSRAALDFHFDQIFKDLYESLKPLAAKGLAGALIDSYETGLQNWTAGFPQEFQKRRGYDLKNYLPAVTGRVVGGLDISERFLWDLRKTQAELMQENYYQHFVELCHAHGINAYTEPYDPGNFDEMAAGAYADTLMGEFWQNQAPHHSLKLVASISHVNGRAVAGAESFTSQSRWTEYPYALKSLGDFVYTQGINRYILHRFAMQPHPTALPGMTMGPWGGHFDRTNTWFNQSSAWLTYAARCQYLLQQGLFAADLLYYAGENSPVRTPDKAALNPAPPPGYDYDTIDPGTILARLKIDNGRIVLPDRMSYRVFVLPNQRTITMPVLRKLRDLVEQGMCLVVGGAKPESTPSLTDYPAADNEIRKLAGDIWGDLNGSTVTERSFGKGRVFWGQPLASVLQKLNVKPDFEFSSRSGRADINNIHRRLGDADFYFVANRGQQSEELVCTFNVERKQPELWDAATGQMVPLAIYDNADGRTRLPLQLDPSGSTFVVFRAAAPARQFQAVTKDGAVLINSAPYPSAKETTAPAPKRGGGGGGAGGGGQQMMPLPKSEEPFAVELAGGPKGELLAWQNGEYDLLDNRDRSTVVKVSGLEKPLEIAGPWRVTFPANLGAPPEITLDKLISWTEHSDAGVKYFSGMATYHKRFTIAAEAAVGIKRLFLDLGRVLVLAEVVVNGKNLGVLWKLPFRVDITEAVHPGENDLEIRVTNLWPNRLIGDEQLPAENQYGGGGRGGSSGAIRQMPDWYLQGLLKPPGGRVTFTTWQHYTKDSPLLESGLIGPVQLRSAARVATER
jgi:hypothetical protein